MTSKAAAIGWLIVSTASFAQNKINVSSMSAQASRGSQLKQTFYVLNDPSCPITVNVFSLVPRIEGTRINYGPSATISASSPVAAFEIRVLLFDVFGEHLKTLNYVEVKPTTGQVTTGTGVYWLFTDHEREVFLTSVAFVSRVRTDAGQIWRYDERAIKGEIDKIETDVKPEALVPGK